MASKKALSPLALSHCRHRGEGGGDSGDKGGKEVDRETQGKERRDILISSCCKNREEEEVHDLG